MMSLSHIASVIGGKVSGGQVLCPGPNHSPDDESLSITLSETGMPVVHSFSPKDDDLKCKDYVLERLGLPVWKPNGSKSRPAIYIPVPLAPSTPPAPLPTPQAAAAPSARRRIVAEYIYKKEDGTPYLRVQRTDPKGFYQSHWDGNVWAKGKPQGPKIPYRLPDLKKFADANIIIVEGEKDVDRLASLDLVATTSSEGAGKWTKDLNQYFAGREIYIIPDRDEPGEMHAHSVASNLHGIAATVKIVRLPFGKDVSEYLDGGGTVSELGRLLNDAPDCDPSQPPKKEPTAEKQEPSNTTTLHLVSAIGVQQKRVEWVWQNRLARGKLTLVAGDPGVGKSQISTDIVARLTSARPWPDGGAALRGACIMLASEDAANDTICPRLELAGADLHRVHIVQAVNEKATARGFDLQAKEIGEVILVTIDPITAYLGANIDSHRTADVRGVMARVERFADEHNIAVLAITHPPKAAQTKAINNFTGSLAFVASARLAFVAVEDTTSERSLLLAVKNNLGPKAGGLGYRLAQGFTAAGILASHVVWDTAPVTVSANEALANAGSKSEPRREAETFLKDYLADGDMEAEAVKEAAEAYGISPKTLRNAREALGVAVQKAGFAGGWVWRLPT
jgi:putative DNA primase/helicase